jgi:c-di-GMP-binding flagellar brake protein YcgR
MGEDRRRWARIEASLECTVATAAATFGAKVVNLSRGGVALMTGPDAVKLGETVSVLLERGAGPVPGGIDGPVSLAFAGKVVRIFGAGDETMVGVHFEALPPDSETELVKLLKLLASGKGSGRREHPRVSARIAVRCKSVESFSALLNDLSRGGLSIRCPSTVEAGGTLRVEFGVAGKEQLISVEGEVTHVQTMPDGKRLAGVSFAPPSDAQRAQVQQLLELLLGIDSPLDDEGP